MMLVATRRCLGSFIYLLVLFALTAGYQSLAQASKDNISTPPTLKKSKGELDEVRFVGNKHISDDVLMSIISSKPTDKSLPHQVLSYYADNAYRNPATPKYIKAAFAYALKDLAYEIKYFNDTRAKNDTSQIIIYYNQFGFHRANATYKFTHDLKKRKNILTFYITENAQWTLRAAKYYGLENIPSPVMALVDKVKYLKVNSPFKEIDVVSEVSSINKILLDNGYYYAKYDYPIITIDPFSVSDSVTVWFRPGLRQKIGSVDFVDSARGQSLVSTPMKTKQLDFQVGDWFSLSDVQRSENNLRSLGTFDMVKIDTSSEFHRQTDTSLSFVGYLTYRKQQEYGLSPFVNQNAAPDRAYNAGLEASYTHRNFLSGAALVFNPFARATVLDLGRWISERKFEWEYQAGINLAQPLLYNFDVARIGGSAQIQFSQRTISDFLKLRTFSLPVKFPTKFPKFTYVNQADVSITLERQEPLNYQQVRSIADTVKDVLEKERLLEALTTYRNIYTYVRDKHPILTAFILGTGAISDNRDNPFSPVIGHYLSADFEWGSAFLGGIAKFIRAQAFYYQFLTLGPQTVLALKPIRIGHIIWFDRAHSYVPYEQQFFAGGANSVRGWYSRQLRYIHDTAYGEDPNLVFLKDFIGSGTIVEGSCEYRFRLAAPNASPGGSSSFLSSISVVPFFDYGNTFQWFVVDSTGKFFENYTISDIINPMNWGWALGVGVRYETPVGPFRVDFGWPIHDPNDKVHTWLWQKPNGFGAVKFHIALGNPF